MKVHEIRQRFLKYFEDNGHTIVRSSSLIPAGDRTLFFTNAGMVQFKNVFSGEERRDYTRAASVQKCMRVSGKHNDLENVGRTPRHHTFFEMLGNFSFGDYFKREAIDFGWEFLTGDMGLDPDRLYATVYREDDEAYELWRQLGLPAERIGRCGKKDNYWSMGDTGPHGPCSEIHWDLREGYALDHEPDPWGRGHDAGRYMEIWNLVFMQYFTHADGRTTDLPRPCVDTGMGLDRLAAVTEGVKTTYETDELTRLVQRAAELAGVEPDADPERQVSLRVLADHGRATAFLLADGVLPSNVDRGYVLRRVMRRAIRHGVELGIDEPFFHTLADTVVEVMAPAYPELTRWREKIVRYTRMEEETFRRTLHRGLELLERTFTGLEGAEEPVVPGDVVFRLHSRDGFPPDLTRVIAEERGMAIDDEGYRTLMTEHRAISGGMGTDATDGAAPGTGTGYAGLQTEFLGYEADEADGIVLAVRRGGVPVEAANAGEQADAVVDRTPLYAESGGQVGDRGTLIWEGGRATVLDTVKEGSVQVHRIQVEDGTLTEGQAVHLQVDGARRGDIRRNHTATHLLHAALRSVLGDHVAQQGSVVDPERLRFDFSHFQAVTAEELAQVERAANEQVRRDTALSIEHTAYDAAVERGAMALFGEKYGDLVRVVEVPGFSIELCGGTHCARTGEIGLIKIVSEGSVGAGVRRIEALTGRGTEAYLRDLERERTELAALLKAQPHEVLLRARRLSDESRAQRKTIEELKQRLAGGDATARIERFDLDGVVLVVGEVEADAKEMRDRADRLQEQIRSGVVVLGSRDEGAARLVVKVSKDLTDRFHAGKIVAQLAAGVDGRGGGRPDMAQAGGKAPERLPEVLAGVPDLLRS